MQAEWYDQLRLEDQIDEIKDRYQKENNAFDIILDWQRVYKDPPTTLAPYSRKTKAKIPCLLRYMESSIRIYPCPPRKNI
jgi:hypothetical protein